MRHPYRPIAIAGAAILATASLVSPAQASSHRTHSDSHRTWRVSPGTGTISHAVARARAGDTLILKAGTFYDSVTIDKKLTIVGAGWSRTTIKPPSSPHSPCNKAGSVVGLCALGALDSRGNPDLRHPVKNVSISRLHLTGFTDGVRGLNTKGLTVHDVRSEHNSGYGIARFNSTQSNFSRNWTSWNDEAGLYLGDSPEAESVVRENRSDHNGIGIFLRDSSRITATDNEAWGNCAGILALSTHRQTPAAGYFTIRDNKTWGNNKACRATDEAPNFSGIGIALASVRGVVVRENTVRANSSAARSDVPKGGIVVFTFPGAPAPTNNRVDMNYLRGNTPADIVWDRTGTGNVVRRNNCTTAIPGNLGWCSN